MGEKFEYEIYEQDNQLQIREQGSGFVIDLRQRLFNFSVASIKFLGTLPVKKSWMCFVTSSPVQRLPWVQIMKKPGELSVKKNLPVKLVFA